jgi:pseudouridine-5'-phosphate glycosidase
VTLLLSSEVGQALAANRAVVALESAVLTHGLPPEWGRQAVLRQFEACRAEAAVPALVAVQDGRLRVGLTEEEWQKLIDSGAAKVSPWNLAAVLQAEGLGGTTVAATVRAAGLCGIRVVSTGGLGGVHPGDGQDVSADLSELERQPVCVVCAGPKSTLDAPATLQRLETAGVPVIGWRSDRLAGFLAHSSGLTLPARVDELTALASLLRRHWTLGGKGAVLSQPLPAELALDRQVVRAAAAPAGPAGSEASNLGPGRTPAELQRLQERLGQRAIEANLALLERNARLAASLARELA